eukprot:1434744-Amphidinium_carterae.1
MHCNYLGNEAIAALRSPAHAKSCWDCQFQEGKGCECVGRLQEECVGATHQRKYYPRSRQMCLQSWN